MVNKQKHRCQGIWLQAVRLGFEGVEIFFHSVSRLILGSTHDDDDDHHHQCSAQGQVLHCKLRHQGCNSVGT